MQTCHLFHYSDVFRRGLIFLFRLSLLRYILIAAGSKYTNGIEGESHEGNRYESRCTDNQLKRQNASPAFLVGYNYFYYLLPFHLPSRCNAQAYETSPKEQEDRGLRYAHRSVGEATCLQEHAGIKDTITGIGDGQAY